MLCPNDVILNERLVIFSIPNSKFFIPILTITNIIIGTHIVEIFITPYIFLLKII